MEEKNKVAIERRLNETDYFVVITNVGTNVGVVAILFFCAFVYLVTENRIDASITKG